MLKHIFKYSLSAVLLLGAMSSCNKEQGEPTIVQPDDNGLQLGFTMTATATEPAQGDDEARLASYSFEGDRKLPKLNFLLLKNPPTEAKELEKYNETLKYAGVPDDKRGKVPVHLFFVNTKLGINSRRYQLVWMDIKGEKELHLPFQDYPHVREQFTEATKDAWYVKAFIGGKAMKVVWNEGSKRWEYNDGSKKEIVLNSPSAPQSNYGKQVVTAVWFSQDNLFALGEKDNTYITHSITKWNNGIRQWQIPLPFPMETPWEKVTFYYKGTDTRGTLTDTPVENFPTEPQSLEFKPLGALMRLQVTNERTEDMPITVFDFSSAPIRSDGQRKRDANGSKTSIHLNEQFYINAITRVIDKLPLEADGVTIKGTTKETLWDGATTIWEKDGLVHYHAKKYDTPHGSDNHEAIWLRAGERRTFFFWLIEDGNPNAASKALTKAFVQPFFHNTKNRNNLQDEDNGEFGYAEGAFKAVYMGNSEDKGIWVERGQWKDGHTYFLKATLRDKKPAAAVQP